MAIHVDEMFLKGERWKGIIFCTLSIKALEVEPASLLELEMELTIIFCTGFYAGQAVYTLSAKLP